MQHLADDIIIEWAFVYLKATLKIAAVVEINK